MKPKIKLGAFESCIQLSFIYLVRGLYFVTYYILLIFTQGWTNDMMKIRFT